MVQKNEVLEALRDTSRYHPLKVKGIAQRLGADPLTLSVQLHRLSKEGLVAKSGQKGGWFIIQKGKERLRMLSKSSTETAPSKDTAFLRKYAAELDAEIQRSRSTDYGKFLELGKVMQVPPNLVQVTTEHVWNSGDYTDPELVWRALTEMVIPPILRKPWFYSWFSFLRRSIPQQLSDEIDSLQ
jgi:DNA-binding transcriptional ArsR family regulator